MGEALPPTHTSPGDGASGAIAEALGLFHPGKSQKEGKEDQGTCKQLGGGPPLAVLVLSGPPGLPSGSSLGSLELPQGIYLRVLQGP